MEGSAAHRQWFAPAGELSGAQMLCFTLPLRQGDRVAVVGRSPELVSALQALGAEPVVVTGPQAPDGGSAAGGAPLPTAAAGRLPLGDAEVDHAILPRLTTALRPLLHGELARVLRPGGGLFVGALWRARSPRDGAALTVRGGRRALHRAGFTEVTVYAARPGLRRPRHLVPWASAEAVRWYLRCAYQPLGWRGAALCRLLTAWGGRRAPLLLFPAVAFTARRRRGRRP